MEQGVSQEGREPDKQVVYLGGTSRSIVERTREHWKHYKGQREQRREPYDEARDNGALGRSS